MGRLSPTTKIPFPAAAWEVSSGKIVKYDGIIRIGFDTPAKPSDRFGDEMRDTPPDAVRS